MKNVTKLALTQQLSAENAANLALKAEVSQLRGHLDRLVLTLQQPQLPLQPALDAASYAPPHTDADAPDAPVANTPTVVEDAELIPNIFTPKKLGAGGTMYCRVNVRDPRRYKKMVALATVHAETHQCRCYYSFDGVAPCQNNFVDPSK